MVKGKKNPSAKDNTHLFSYFLISLLSYFHFSYIFIPILLSRISFQTFLPYKILSPLFSDSNRWTFLVSFVLFISDNTVNLCEVLRLLWDKSALRVIFINKLLSYVSKRYTFLFYLFIFFPLKLNE